MTSSLSCLSVIRSPLSSSASISMERRSPLSSSRLLRRSLMMAWTIASSLRAALSKRRLCGVGMLLGIRIRRRCEEKSSRATFIALPTSLASAPTSASKRHLATISSVKRVISSWTSTVWPARQPSSERSAKLVITSP